MAEAKSGDTLKVHYTGKLDDGSVFDSSESREPLEVTLGAGGLIAGFEQALVGMAPGESKTVTIESDDAYGAYDDAKVHEVDRSRIPEEIELQPGRTLMATTANGDQVRLTVAAVSEQSVTLDENHPLAGKDLTFDIRVVEIVEA